MRPLSWLAGLLAIIAAIGGGAAWALYLDYQRFLDTPLVIAAEGQDYLLKPGSSLAGISRDFTEHGLWHNADLDPYWFRLLARQKRLAHRLQAGEYTLRAGQTPIDILETLVSGKVNQYAVTLVEGWTIKQLLHSLHRQPKLTATLRGLDHDQLMQALGHPKQHPEGRFLAETYHYTAGTSDAAILRRAYDSMQTLLNKEWRQRAPKLPYKDPYEALIMASIIEKETSVPAERPRIAGVFVRRLNKGMRLQTDPTVIYGMGAAYNGNIRRQDLRTDTPYNTYTRKGLPPSPIATPGPEAIHAALHPAPGNELYFVASGNGGHQFSATLKEHNRAVQRYQIAPARRQSSRKASSAQ